MFWSQNQGCGDAQVHSCEFRMNKSHHEAILLHLILSYLMAFGSNPHVIQCQSTVLVVNTLHQETPYYNVIILIKMLG